MNRSVTLNNNKYAPLPDLFNPPPNEVESGLTVRVTFTINSWLASQGSAKSSQTYSESLTRVTKIVPFSYLLTIDDTEVRSIIVKLFAKYKPATVKLTISAMSSLWNFLIAARITSDNPWAHTKTPNLKDTLRERLLTEFEVNSLIDHAPPGRDHAFVRFLYGTGLRVSESVSVTWQDISWDNDDRCWATIYGKGGKTRTVQIPDGVIAELVQLWVGKPHEGQLWQFTTRTGVRIMERLRKVVGKDVSPHWMRHARATHAIRHGAPLHLVQANLGHASAVTTARYLHAMPGESDAQFMPDI